MADLYQQFAGQTTADITNGSYLNPTLLPTVRYHDNGDGSYSPTVYINNPSTSMGTLADTVWQDSTGTIFVYRDTGTGTPTAYSLPNWAVYTPVPPMAPPELSQLTLLVNGSAVNAGNPMPVYNVYSNYSTPVQTSFGTASAVNTAATIATAGNDVVVATINVVNGSGTNITNGVFTFEVYDGFNWLPVSATLTGTYATAQTVTVPYASGTSQSYRINVGGYSQARVRLSTVLSMTGTTATCTVTLAASSAATDTLMTVGLDPSNALPTGSNTIGNTNMSIAAAGYTYLTDGTRLVTLKAASTAAQAADVSLVTAFSPNTPLPTGSNTIGNVNQTPTTAGYNKVTDGTNTATVKAASTAAGTADTALVVSISPNSPTPAGSNTIGNVNQSITVAGYGKLTDGTSTVAVKAASTAVAAADPALAVSLSPNSPLPSGSNTIGNMNQTNSAPGYAKLTDGTNNVAIKASGVTAASTDPAMVVTIGPNSPLPSGSNTLGNVNQTIGASGYGKVTDGTNTAAVIASSTAAVATNPALAVALSPNSPLPAGTNNIGTVNQAIATAGYEKLTDGTSVASFAIASTAVAATQTSLSVGLSPNSPLPAGANTIGKVNQTAATAGYEHITDGTNTVVVTPGSSAAAAASAALTVALSPGSPLPAGTNNLGFVNQTAASAGYGKVTDGTSTVGVTAASSAAVASNPAMVVALSPNSPVPSGSNTIGNVTATQVTGSATGGTAAASTLASGGIYNSTQPTLTAGQQAALQLDANGNLRATIQNASLLQSSTVINGTNRTAAANGTTSTISSDHQGRLIATLVQQRTLLTATTLTITSSTVAQTLLAANATLFNDLVSITVSNSSATATLVTVSDGSKSVLVFNVPAGTTQIIPLTVPIPQSVVNKAWTVTTATSVNACYVSALFSTTT